MDMAYFIIRGLIFLAIFLAVALVTRKRSTVFGSWIGLSLVFGIASNGFGGGGIGSAIGTFSDPFIIGGVIIAMLVARPKTAEKKSEAEVANDG
jgi:hypothetical protein